MANCGCGAFPTCSCVLTGDPATMTVKFSGNAIAPWLAQVKGYPNPRPYGVVHHAGTQSLTAGVELIVPWNGNLSDPSTMWDASAPTRLTAPLAGTYLVCAGNNDNKISNANYGFTSASSGTQRGVMALYKNGTGSGPLFETRMNTFKQPAVPTTKGGFDIEAVIRLVAGDYIQFGVTLVGDVDALTSPVLQSAWMTLRWMGL